MSIGPKSRAPLIPPSEAMRKMGTTRGLLITAGGLGFIQPAGGTWGSVPPVAVALLLAILAVPEWQLNLVGVLIGLVGVVSCLRALGAAEPTLANSSTSMACVYMQAKAMVRSTS